MGSRKDVCLVSWITLLRRSFIWVHGRFFTHVLGKVFQLGSRKGSHLGFQEIFSLWFSELEGFSFRFRERIFTWVLGRMLTWAFNGIYHLGSQKDFSVGFWGGVSFGFCKRCSLRPWEGFSLGFSEGFTLRPTEGFALRFVRRFSLWISAGLLVRFAEGCSFGSLDRCHSGFWMDYHTRNCNELPESSLLAPSELSSQQLFILCSYRDKIVPPTLTHIPIPTSTPATMFNTTSNISVLFHFGIFRSYPIIVLIYIHRNS